MNDILLVEGDNELNVPMVPTVLPEGTLEGGVTDAETGFHMWDVKVTVNGFTAYTAHYRPDIGYGSYQFKELEPGEYIVSFERFGYEPLTLTKTLYSGENRLDIEMIPLSPELLPIQVVDLDSNNNGVVDEEDETAFLAAYGSKEGDPDYDRQFDANFDGIIDDWDYNTFYRTLGKNLSAIRNSIKTGIYEHLVWPDGYKPYLYEQWVWPGGYDAYLVALNKDTVEEFTGYGLTKDGWISVLRHPSRYGAYVCANFAMDTATAAYRGLGYGCLLFSKSMTHGYNIFWIGGDWRDLNNWYILEPQYGKVFCAAKANLSSIYQTVGIFFPYSSCKFVLPGFSPGIFAPHLAVDYEQKLVTYGDSWGGHCTGQQAYNEEPIPIKFNRAFMV